MTDATSSTTESSSPQPQPPAVVESSSVNLSTTKAAAPKKTKLSKTLPTDRINFPKQFDIIVGYSIAYDKAGQQPVSNQDVGNLVKLAAATVGMMNAFNMDVGIIQRTDGGKFMPSEETRECARMHQINPDRAWLKLAPLFERSWFGEELIAKLKIRSLSESEAIEDLAEIAHAEKDHLPQLKVALEYMEKCGVIVREGGMIKLASRSSRDETDEQDKGNKVNSASSHNELHKVEIIGLECHSLTLDPLKKRKIVIHTPPSITEKELDRIQKWLSFQLIVTTGDDENVT